MNGLSFMIGLWRETKPLIALILELICQFIWSHVAEASRGKWRQHGHVGGCELHTLWRWCERATVVRELPSQQVLCMRCVCGCQASQQNTASVLYRLSNESSGGRCSPKHCCRDGDKAYSTGIWVEPQWMTTHCSCWKCRLHWSLVCFFSESGKTETW